jgi:hypothetical protein
MINGSTGTGGFPPAHERINPHNRKQITRERVLFNAVMDLLVA